MSQLRRRKIGDQHYEITRDGVILGTAVKTGSHLDDYPWNWMLAQTVKPRERANGLPPKTLGNADTLRSAVEAMDWNAQ